MDINPPDLSTLRRLRPLAQFNDEQLQSLANQLNVCVGRRNEILIEIGCVEEFSLYVLKGDISSTAADGKTKQLSFNDSDELNPVSQLRPSMFNVKAEGLVQYLKIDKNLLTAFANHTQTDSEDISLEFFEQDDDNNPLTFKMFQDIMSDNVVLPSLPEVAVRIQQVFKDDQADADKVAEILMTDPAITGKLIKIANSPVYQGVTATDTLQAAIVRLGMDTTYKQVMAYAVNELFRSHSDDVSKRMADLWTHSRKVAAISRVLAKSTGLFNPEQAMLAGLVHDLGVIVIVEYLQQHDEQITDPEKIEQTINSLRPQITGMLMQKWNFSEEIVRVAEECEEWFRNESDEPDLCDLVMIAQLHSLMGTEAMQHLPPITTLPAMTKLKMGPKESIELIKQSNQEISAIESLLQ
jgi:HD-like signal output (HDOD) protein